MTQVATQALRVRPLAQEMLLIGGLAGLTTLASKLAVVLPWTPVPATLQVAAVLFAGAAFGARRGALSQLLYLSMGLCGLPVFAGFAALGPASVLTPSFGYLLAFPLAAYLAGHWSSRRGLWLGSLAGLGSIYLIGGLWLAAWALATGLPISGAWLLWAGVLVFLPLDLAKVALVVFSARPLRRKTR